MKTCKTKYILLAAVVALSGACRCSLKETVLVENGVAKCRIVVSDGTPLSAEFGAEEIARCFKKATGAQTPVSKEGENAAGIPIVIGMDASLPEEGFAIDVTPEKVSITGADARGVLYGCYEVLKRWAGMRWLVPGEDGEYCVHEGGTIAVPHGRITASPSLAVRTYGCEHEEDHLWSARNNMQSVVGWRSFGKPDSTQSKRLEKMAVYGRGLSGHCLTRLMCNYFDDPKKIFAEHPEYFCLVKGKRKISGLAGYGPNPCTSNREVLDRIANTIVRIISEPHGGDAPVIIGNDDNMQWCECDNCRALDPKETADSPRGKRSDRYWWTVNEIARRVWAKRPDAKLGGWAYQDFWLPPVRVKPDPRLSLTISYNNQCWRHSMNDPKCPENSEMAGLYNMWKPFGFKTVVNRNEFSCEGCPGGTFSPAELIVTKNIRESADLGCNGHTWAVRGPFPDPLPWEAKNPDRYPPYGGRNLKWFACWQSMYAIARAGWDKTRDIEAELEEANRLYYGKAWEGGMKEFRAVLHNAYTGTPWCVRWPNQKAISPFLDYPGAEAALSDCLKRALSAAADDPRALKHVKDVRDIFACTWVREHGKRKKSYLEADFLARRHPLTQEGAIDARDLDEAESIAGFIDDAGGKTVDAAEATYIRGVYDRSGINLAVTALLPRSGERLEIKVTRPDKTPGTAKAQVTFDGKSRGCWLANVTVKAEDLGAPVLDGTVLKLEATRIRGEARQRLTRFIRCRPTRAVASSFRRTQPVWQNGSFDALGPKGVPIGWNASKKGVEARLHPQSESDRYVHLGEGSSEIGQGYYLPATAKRRYRIVARVRGSGSVRFWASSYHRVGGVNGYNAIVDGSAKSQRFKLTDDWQTRALETESTGKEDELISVRFFREGKDARVDIDDCFVVPLDGR